MRAAAIVGLKKSGKTALGVELARTLTAMGLRVAASKHTLHHFDKADSDTSDYAQVCAGVIGLSPGESFVSWPTERRLHDLLSLVKAEVLVLEGGKEFGYLPRVLVLNRPEEAAELSPELALATFGPVRAEGLPQVQSVEELARLVLTRGFLLPGLDCGACGRPDCRGLAADIVAGRASAGDCSAAKASMRVTAGGAELALNPFVERILRAGITGMLSELKGFAPGRIEITLEG